MNDWKEKIRTMRRSSVVIYPTETSYAIGCDATDARAVWTIFRLKGRECGKPLPLIVASRAMAERWAVFTPLARALARRYWPGPLTLVLSPRGISHYGRAAALASGILAPDGGIALRVSSHPIARALSRRLGGPIVSTSANRSGGPPAFSIRAATAALAPTAERLGIAPAAFDGGVLPHRSPSMVVDARGASPIILRPKQLVHQERKYLSK